MKAEQPGKAVDAATIEQPAAAIEQTSTAGMLDGLEAIAEASIPRSQATLPIAVSPEPAKLTAQSDVPIGGLALGWLQGEGDDYEVRIGGAVEKAILDASLHPTVALTARDRREAVIVTRAPHGELTVMGALRTSPTPGVDEMDEISLKAKRIRIEATEDAEIRAGIAVIALRAVGEIETYADRIVSRAEELQKLVARMLRLN